MEEGKGLWRPKCGSGGWFITGCHPQHLVGEDPVAGPGLFRVARKPLREVLVAVQREALRQLVVVHEALAGLHAPVGRGHARSHHVQQEPLAVRTLSREEVGFEHGLRVELVHFRPRLRRRDDVTRVRQMLRLVDLGQGYSG